MYWRAFKRGFLKPYTWPEVTFSIGIVLGFVIAALVYR